MTVTDLRAIESFFDMTPTAAMPESVLRLVLSGTQIRSGNLETAVSERGWEIAKHAPDIAKKIGSSDVLPDVLIVKDKRKVGVIHVYDPETGQYRGTFNLFPEGVLR